MFNERKALQMTLQAMLEQRMVLRRQYVDQDKQLGADIKQLLNRIREMDMEAGIEAVEASEEVAVAAEELPADMAKRIKVRKTHIRHNYQEVADYIENILRENMSPMSLVDLCSILKERHDVEFASPYIGVQKSLKYLPQVKVEKDGRKLIFSLA
ncbi:MULTISPECIES: hypothetical protein [Brevibacillus]|uniref:hypothetical protein n=1 Tax=Brevibacillus TaxID=55080 RepID=UPI0007AB405C|nr:MULTISPECIES: hypothetical protein [Brevibacillus]KZE51751.1 hypothetical protein AV540_12860 [Brevibacillus parabrevis]MBU8712578.1 hypothetical protein [Brevibacillus parabrevis]MDH6348076.1 ElaB/YqjD/DUF883 family membrane-anchored ribosome-binding protein [Brevibacillus sp. 1238]MDR5000201.1 hypothetical protein [Brevibacillus parabrevis]HBZ80058.1 hypothetical protein [Brevibacillus sp.]